MYRTEIHKIRDDVITGIQLHMALRATKRFPVLLLQMSAIGEESSALDDMLKKAVLHYEEAVDNLTILLEPLIMSVLGVLVGGLLIAMYLPIFKLGAVI
ncbi:MAG: type IV pilus assembly protein PilC [Porticoccus sp.]